MGLYWFETFYRIGSYIFGGGQVVLPLIVEQVVQYKDECTMVMEKEICTRKPDYEVYEEDDEFEEFAQDNWDAAAEDAEDPKLWQDDWDDDDVDDDFCRHLREELQKPVEKN